MQLKRDWSPVVGESRALDRDAFFWPWRRVSYSLSECRPSSTLSVSQPIKISFVISGRLIERSKFFSVNKVDFNRISHGQLRDQKLKGRYETISFRDGKVRFFFEKKRI